MRTRSMDSENTITTMETATTGGLMPICETGMEHMSIEMEPNMRVILLLVNDMARVSINTQMGHDMRVNGSKENGTVKVSSYGRVRSADMMVIGTMTLGKVEAK